MNNIKNTQNNEGEEQCDFGNTLKKKLKGDKTFIPPKAGWGQCFDRGKEERLRLQERTPYGDWWAEAIQHNRPSGW